MNNELPNRVPSDQRDVLSEKLEPITLVTRLTTDIGKTSCVSFVKHRIVVDAPTLEHYEHVPKDVQHFQFKAVRKIVHIPVDTSKRIQVPTYSNLDFDDKKKHKRDHQIKDIQFNPSLFWVPLR